MYTKFMNTITLTKTRICNGCKAEKDLDEFYPVKHGKYGKAAKCKGCMYELVKKSNEKNPGIKRNSRWKNRFKILNPNGTQFTYEDYEVMVTLFGDKCQVCGRTEKTAQNKTFWTVDHDHETGIVRGLVCFNCNVGLGALGDNIEGLEKALSYLKKHYA